MTAETPKRDKPWIFRTYAGHSTAKDSNALYRKNLAKGQTGLSVAFDLPTQTGYDSDHVLAKGEVGKVGVPISHVGDMRALFTGIPLATMNTSMTINATAAWLMALYIAVADEQGAPRASLTGTIQNDIIKEYLSRGTYVFPPKPSLRLIKDIAIFTTSELPKWNPMNVCSYHLQEAGATPVQELAFALATAIAVLDTVKASGEVDHDKFCEVVGRISFFVNAGLRFVTEVCKMRAFVDLWDEITRTRYGVTDPKQRLFRYGVQVNSLGLTEQQAENNVTRILIEMLAVTLSKKARARAVQLPAWNEALGLPRPWDQQWSLRMQQILAYETDLLEYGDIFDGSAEIERKVEALKREAKEELRRIEEMGGAVAAVESGYMKQQLVESNTARLEAIERFLTPSTLDELLDRGYDVVLDACDAFRVKLEAIAWCRRRKLPMVTVGSAGGRTDPTQIRVRDLSRTEHDAMFSLIRKKLRQDFNFPKNPDRYFGVSAVYSLQNVQYPQPDGTVCGTRPPVAHGTEALNLACGGGLGAATHVTGAFAFAAVGKVMERLLQGDKQA